MIRVVLWKMQQVSHEDFQKEYRTLDLEVPELERLLRTPAPGESRFERDRDWNLSGIELLEARR